MAKGTASKKSEGVTSLSMNMKSVFEMHTALQGLDSYEVRVGDRAIKEFYQLGAARYDVATNMLRLQKEMETFEVARLALVKECRADGKADVEKSDPGWTKFSDEFSKMMLAERTIELRTIKRSRLKLDVNPIPILVLAALGPIIVDDEPEA